ncbi:META domain-containing protein [Vibrio sp. V39_P1S14PM300]|uniref:META domain-containing protein n=1 Tax=Vibrio sp. V39_P1S14PM300 TaxID=1938690 RepID=UPI0013732860|nr:META domain-containing protein [Vibrio sp. V39_P1S14PM300]NAX20137.1 META domain-containing protein [Vibrio sp. V39_P1S14PM300]
MKLSVTTLLAGIPLALLSVGCSMYSGSAELTPQDLQHHNWELIQVDGQAITQGDRQRMPRLEVGEKMTVNGNAGCNNFFGQGELKDNQFRVDKIGMTMKSCSSEAMQIEQAVAETLSTWSTITLTKEHLILRDDNHELTYRLRDWVN